MPVKRRAVSALVLAETISVLGTRMTYLALPWFVLVTTGSPSKMSLVLAAEILPMAILGVPSGALVQRLGSRTTMLVCRPRARADPCLDSAAVRGGDPPLLAPARDRRAARSLRAAVLRSAADDPPRARRRGRDAHVAGEQLDRGWKCACRAARPGACRRAHPVPRRPERPVRRCCDLSRRVRPRPRLRASHGRRPPRLPSTACSRACGSSCRTSSSARSRRRSRSSDSSPPGCPPGSPCMPTTSSTGAPGSRASSMPRSARAPSWGACSPSSS